jgi:DNA-binding NtrC family response regulator
VDVVLTDMAMPDPDDGSGCSARSSGTPTRRSSCSPPSKHRGALDTIQKGAFDYLTKPLTSTPSPGWCALEQRRLVEENKSSGAEAAARAGGPERSDPRG